MHLSTDAFRHSWHSSPDGGNLSCLKCHEAGEIKSAATAKKCSECHNDLYPEGAVIEVKNYRAVSYSDAMHRLCIGCHADSAAARGTPELARCGACHKGYKDPGSAALPPKEAVTVMGSPVLPPLDMKKE